MHGNSFAISVKTTISFDYMVLKNMPIILWLDSSFFFGNFEGFTLLGISMRNISLRTLIGLIFHYLFLPLKSLKQSLVVIFDFLPQLLLEILYLELSSSFIVLSHFGLLPDFVNFLLEKIILLINLVFYFFYLLCNCFNVSFTFLFLFFSSPLIVKKFSRNICLKSFL